MNTCVRILVLVSFVSFPSLAAAASGALRTVALRGQAAPGVPSMTAFNGFFDTPALNAAGRTAFLASLQTGGDVTTENELGIWSEGSGALALVAREGSPAPGTPVGVSYGSSLLAPIGLNNAGQAAFRASLRGVGVASENDFGIWSELNGPLELVAREGNQAPGTPAGAIYRTVGLPRLVDDSLTFTAGLQIGLGGVTGIDDSGVWSGDGGALEPIAREGSQVPGTPAGVIFSNLVDFTPALSAGGQTGFRGFLRVGVGGVTSNDDTGIWSQSGGALSLVAREGTQAPGAPAGVNFADIGFDFRAINAAGQVAFRAALQIGGGVTGLNDSGYWSQGSGPLALVAREGDPAPGAPAGSVFGHLSNSLILNAAGHTAFVGTLQNGLGGVTFSNDSGIWSDRSGALELVAREGSQAPGTPSGANFDFMPRSSASIVLNSAGQMAVFASLRSGSGGVNSFNNSGIWAEDVAGVLRLIVRRGDLLEVAPGDFRTVSSLSFRGDSGNEDGRGSGFNDLGQVAFIATFTDSTSGVFVSNLATLPEPTALTLGIVTVMLGAATMRRGRR
jgi:hypothetical protein